ncbi:hypothetical protein FHT97_005083 [Rhizobium sp. BK399]|nr:hypothetical protein [Rhizobium sp. BK399]
MLAELVSARSTPRGRPISLRRDGSRPPTSKVAATGISTSPMDTEERHVAMSVRNTILISRSGSLTTNVRRMTLARGGEWSRRGNDCARCHVRRHRRGIGRWRSVPASGRPHRHGGFQCYSRVAGRPLADDSHPHRGADIAQDYAISWEVEDSLPPIVELLQGVILHSGRCLIDPAPQPRRHSRIRLAIGLNS